MTGGMAYEGLNNLGHSGSKVVMILNDNGRSYAPTVSRLSREPDQAPPAPRPKSRSGPGWRTSLRDLPGVGGLAHASFQGMYSAIREVLEPPAFFEAWASATSVPSTAMTSPAWSRPSPGRRP